VEELDVLDYCVNVLGCRIHFGLGRGIVDADNLCEIKVPTQGMLLTCALKSSTGVGLSESCVPDGVDMSRCLQAACMNCV
jgi:hypothetical protein